MTDYWASNLLWKAFCDGVLDNDDLEMDERVRIVSEAHTLYCGNL